VEVQLEADDYVKACLAIARFTRRSILVIVASSIVFVSGSLFLFSQAGNSRAGAGLSGAWFGALAGVYLVRRLGIPIKARRIFGQSPALQRPYQITWDDQALTTIHREGTGTFPWAEFHKARELDTQFLVFFSDPSFLMVPKRAFPDDATLRNFRDCIHAHVRRPLG
jgi:hypothetical protein